ncbi:hypothetical protein [Flavobacterium wongokense]|uniref:hypothetical protein n=1 Tax=Flavobacterium wongokense TaxID=2910674 RepID=UPI001F269600|nr:hypothetical protein [Flavobacterium sp. WG47]MCF6132170.1 hypothetical protein [Flavobacterium sp. WG47]
MKAVFSISFLVALLWQPFYQMGYISYWEINKDQIAKTECINRFKPMMHCNGKCQLYRQLKKAADEEAANNKLPMAVLKLKPVDSFIEMTTFWQPNIIKVLGKKTVFSNYSNSPLNGYLTDLLKPPQVLSW